MASFHNNETSERLDVMYIASNGAGRAVLRGAGPSPLAMRPPSVVVDGIGRAHRAPIPEGRPGEYHWRFEDLVEGSTIWARDSSSNVLARMTVARVNTLESFRVIHRRFHSRGMSIDLDDHIAYVCHASPILGEGLAFRPKDAAAFKAAIRDTRLFHHDDRSDPFGHTAAAATIGEGYREVSTPSLHVAIASSLASVHVDSYAFMLRGPDGTFVITPDVGQHIFDELLFRLPLPWLRRKGQPFLASVLQALHPVLPHSGNRYAPVVGLRLSLGQPDSSDLRSGVPRFMLESTVDLGGGRRGRVVNEATLRIASGGDPKRNPDWVLSLKAKSTCSDVFCRDHQETVGLFLSATGQ